MAKRLCALLVSLLLIFQVGILAFAANESGSPKHIRRVVSVVFDDSGSMYDGSDRWAYASYAMQCFAAMMSSEDVLYVTYLNSPSTSGAISLTSSSKQNSIDKLFNVGFGGGTPDKLSQGAQYLENDYKKYGDDAKYYLVVMADGELDNGGDINNSLKNVASRLNSNLSDADCQTIYFSMGLGNPSIPGVVTKEARTSTQIASVLREISADIMGQTKVDHSVTNGKLTFNLDYPALNIAVFVQRENVKFTNVNLSVNKDGKSVSYGVNTYYVNCPTDINKRDKTWTEIVPSDPPGGFVSLITNGNNSVAKGKYTIDLSAYGLTEKDVIVLVEPAVKVGCKYYLGDSLTPMTFSEMKAVVREGDPITIECGLYELNSDGSLGEAVPLSVLSPEYKLYVNDVEVGEKVSGKSNTYRIHAKNDYENQELKIEARLEGYQPFVVKETFGTFKVKPVIDDGDSDFASEIKLTKPMWEDWVNGNYKISFPLKNADVSVLSDVYVKMEGTESFAQGSLSMDGSTVVYTPAVASGKEFTSLEKEFSFALYDKVSETLVSKVKVSVVTPQYKFDVQSDLDASIGLEFLKNNTDKSVKFTLLADYDGSGNFVPVSESTCDKDIKIELNKGALSGNVTENVGEVVFVPCVDSQEGEGSSLADIVGKDHSIYAVATIDGVEIKSEAINLVVPAGSYKVVVENNITEAFTLDTIKTNSQKIIFTLLADYKGDGTYGAVEDWDTGVYSRLVIDSGDLPGKFETEYDSGGKPIGKSFTPLYDENNNNGVVFTAVAGKTHKIVGSIEVFGVSAETTVEVLAPKYEIVVLSDGITVVDVDLLTNEQGVKFSVLRNDRALTKQELEHLAPYQLSFGEEQNWVKLEAQAMEDADGTAYLLCVPKYDGWTFISPKLWNWLCLFKVSMGDTTVCLTVGADTGVASIHIGTSVTAWIWFCIVMVVIVLLLWIVFCCLTRIKFSRGTFYNITFVPSLNGYSLESGAVIKVNANKGGLLQFLLKGKFIIPFSMQTKNVNVDQRRAAFTVVRPTEITRRRTFPHSVVENAAHFCKGTLTPQKVKALVRGQTIEINALQSNTHSNRSSVKMGVGIYLIEPGSNKVLMFVSKKQEREYRRN